MAGNEQVERQRAAIDTARANRSVLDSPLQKAGQWAFDLIYGDGTPNPADFVNPIGGVTGYITKGVPDVARRAAQTAKITERIGEVFAGHPQLDAALDLVRRNPRVAAHMTDLNGWQAMDRLDMMNSQRGALARALGREPSVVSGLRLPTQEAGNKFGSVAVPLTRPTGTAAIDPMNTLAHEMGHTAQAIGIGDRGGGIGALVTGRDAVRARAAAERSAESIGARQALMSKVPGRGVRRFAQKLYPAQSPELPDIVRDELIQQLRGTPK